MDKKLVKEKFEAICSKYNLFYTDIFTIINNYVNDTTEHSIPFELFKIPISDTKVCAFSFVRTGRLFLVINSNLQLFYQIFAAAYMLYHIYCYFDEENYDLFLKGASLISLSPETITLGENEEDNDEAFEFAMLYIHHTWQKYEADDWDKVPDDRIGFGSLKENFNWNKQHNALSPGRLEDEKRIKELENVLRGEIVDL